MQASFCSPKSCGNHVISLQCPSALTPDWNKDLEDKQSGRVACFLICHFTVCVSNYSYISTFLWKTFMFSLNPPTQFQDDLEVVYQTLQSWGLLPEPRPYSEVNPLSCHRSLRVVTQAVSAVANETEPGTVLWPKGQAVHSSHPQRLCSPLNYIQVSL